MADYYRAKIVAKRQVTLPAVMLDQLGLGIGDELEFTVEDGRIREVRPFRPMPLNPFTPEVRETLARREQEIANGVHGEDLTLPDPEKAAALEVIQTASPEALMAVVQLLRAMPSEKKLEVTMTGAYATATE